MKLQKNFTTELFTDYFQNNTDGTHSIKLVVGDISFDVNKFILNCWTDEFNNKADDDHEIFLPEFDGHKEEIKLCVDLLHGKEIHVDISNVAVILKFATMFKVSDMIKSVMKWFQDNITLTSFLDISCITCNLNKVGHRVDQLFEIIRHFIEENTVPCIEIISDNFVDDVRFVLDVLLYDGPCFGKCISLFNSETRKDAEYKYLLEKIELITAENETFMVEHSVVLNQLLEKVMEQANDPEILRKFLRFSRNVPAAKPGSSSGSEKSVLQFQNWRKISKSELLYLQNNPDLKEYQYAAVCLDWIQEHKPEEGVVLKVYHSIKQEKLEYDFVDCISNTLYSKLKCYNIPCVRRLPVYEYEDQYWSISKRQLLGCLNNNTAVQLSCDCYVTNCTNKQTKHTVNIRLVNTSDKVSVQVLPVNTDNVHTHFFNHYVFWYLVGYTYTGADNMSTFYTNTYQEIVEFVKKQFNVYVRCLMYKL